MKRACWAVAICVGCSGEPGQVPPPEGDLTEPEGDPCGECWDWCGKLNDFESVFWCSQECNRICSSDELLVSTGRTACATRARVAPPSRLRPSPP
jgi:hypothetical protein